MTYFRKYALINIMECRVCKKECEEKFEGLILGKYKVKYYFCPNCEHLQTEKPFWLEEAYKDSIAPEDTGILQRNLNNRVAAASVLSCFYDIDKKFLDYAGGYGVFVRLMRDVGFDFVWADKFSQNLFARGFEYKQDDKIDLITAFEVLEHLENPVEELKKMFDISSDILFTQNILPLPVKRNWWYYAPSGGQHISFYTNKTLDFIADIFGKRHLSGGEYHLFTGKDIEQQAFEEVIKNSAHIYLQNAVEYQSRIASDMEYIINLKKS